MVVFDAVFKHVKKPRELGTVLGLGPAFFLVYTYMDVSENNGIPKSSILIGVFHYKPSILGYPYFWKHLYIDPGFSLVVVGISSSCPDRRDRSSPNFCIETNLEKRKKCI